MAVGIISHPDCLLHEMGSSHPEQPDRLRVIDKELRLSGLSVDLKMVEAPRVTREQLLRVHDANYIDSIAAASPQHGLVCLDADTWMNRYTLLAAEHAAGAVVHGVDLVMAGELRAAFCNVRPPGHHAERAQAMGFCFFNNIAVGAAHALEHHHLQRVAIIDFDVHHGNGTENIFKKDPRVMLCSSFQHPFYPFSGAETRQPHIVNVPLAIGSSGREFRTAAMRWFPLVKAFQPDMIFFSAGFDAHEREKLANLALHEEDYVWITQQIKTIAEEVCQGRIVSALEGGYALDVLGRCVAAHVGALLLS